MGQGNQDRQIHAEVESLLSEAFDNKRQPRITRRQASQGRSFLCGAFSLVEVVLAIGVTSFALLSMIALLPVGLRTTRQAADATTQSQIVQYVRNQLEMTSFNNLSSWNASILYFDNQGLPTTNGDPEQVYAVTFGVGNVGLSTAGNGTNAYLGPNSNLVNSAGNTLADAQLVQLYIVNRTMPGYAATNLCPIVVPNAGF